MPSQAKKEKGLGILGLTMREFQVFLIFLQHEGEKISFFKDQIDKKLGLTSRTKAYDYINKLYDRNNPSSSYLEKVDNSFFVKQNIRKQYERFIIPTLTNVKESIKEYLDDLIDETHSVEKIRDKFCSFSDELKLTIIEVLEDSSISKRDKKKLEKKILGEFENSLKVELVKYQLFSE